ncbi:sulfurtransferase TusA family protein [Chlorobium sp.]|uniref:sulfurtransferase TusA family protein n=1 Tax=Chlorobium sp. TaxID=1095 RepID=UPI002F3F29FE
MSEITANRTLDCSGMNCPLPILKTKKEIDQMQSGEVLKMISTDSGSANDMSSWSNRTGHKIVGSSVEGGSYTFYIQKS